MTGINDELWNITADDNFSNSSGENTFRNLNPYYFYETEQFVFLGILFVLIVLGNCLVLIALLMDKRTKSRMNFFILHLSLTDLSVGLINVLTDIIWRWTVTWHAGNLACKIIRFVQAIVTYSSTYILVALSIDRYDAITHPMNFSSSPRRARALVILAWAFSALFSAPIFVLYEEKYVESQLQCWIELQKPWHWQLYMTLVATALFFMPAVIISVCYSIIVFTIWTKGKILIPQTNNVKFDEVVNRRASARGIIPRAKVKTVKMTFVIIFVFILCWSPYIIFDLLQVYDYVPKTQTNIAIATFIQSLAPLNSAANPLICCFFSTHIRRNIRRMPIFKYLCRLLPAHRRSLYRTDSTLTTMTENLRSRNTQSMHLRHLTVKFSENDTYYPPNHPVTNF